jgi:predicted metalloprotease with PDZ domain
MELERTRVELQKSQLTAAQAQTETVRHRLEAERAQFAAQQMAGQLRTCRTETTPPPTATAPAKAAPPPVAAGTGIVQGRFRFTAQPRKVELRVQGMGVDEKFSSDDKGRVALELPVGSYQATLKAKGYRAKVIQFDVGSERELRLDTKLSR